LAPSTSFEVDSISALREILRASIDNDDLAHILR
jgi:hypothetical protein